jgi:hypothetical protein
VAASDPNYCRWLLKQPFVRREFPALHRALEGLALPQGRARVVRVERHALGGCSLYTFPSERIVRRPPSQQCAGAMAGSVRPDGGSGATSDPARWSANEMSGTLKSPDVHELAATELGSDGNPIGRDPRRMTPDELGALGHQPMSATAAIRAHCLDCCAGSTDEVRKCLAVQCPSWPWRTGTNPWRTPASERQREAARRTAARINAGRANSSPVRPFGTESISDGVGSPKTTPH